MQTPYYNLLKRAWLYASPNMGKTNDHPVMFSYIIVSGALKQERVTELASLIMLEYLSSI